MLDRRFILVAAAAALCAGPALAGVPKALDPDADGTIDLAEAKKAAGALFDKLDKDHEGTLDIKELHGRVSKADLAGADPDKDTTLTKDEYLALVEKKFKAADPDNEGTLDAKELHSKAGKALLKLLK
jgi:Ca2+-binding EF-hand superfamily protein